MEYRVQRPTTMWVEVFVEADNFDEALDRADELFVNGDFTDVDDTFSVNYDRYWIQDENGETEEAY